MRELYRMVIVMTLLSALSGGLLAGVRMATSARIEEQKLEFVKGPAIKRLLAGAQKDPIAARFAVKDGGAETLVFPGLKGSKPFAVALESFGKGYGKTPLGVMVAINTDSDAIAGIAVTTHSETPGLGARAQSDPSFAKGFAGLSAKEPVHVKADGGKVDALSGASITSRGVCAAVTRACEFYEKHRDEIVKKAAAAASSGKP